MPVSESKDCKTKAMYTVMVEMKVIPHIGRLGFFRLGRNPKAVGTSAAIAAVMLAKAKRIRTRARTMTSIMMPADNDGF